MDFNGFLLKGPSVASDFRAENVVKLVGIDVITTPEGNKLAVGFQQRPMAEKIWNSYGQFAFTAAVFSAGLSAACFVLKGRVNHAHVQVAAKIFTVVFAAFGLFSLSRAAQTQWEKLKIAIYCNDHVTRLNKDREAVKADFLKFFEGIEQVDARVLSDEELVASFQSKIPSNEKIDPEVLKSTIALIQEKIVNSKLIEDLKNTLEQANSTQYRKIFPGVYVASQEHHSFVMTALHRFAKSPDFSLMEIDITLSKLFHVDHDKESLRWCKNVIEKSEYAEKNFICAHIDWCIGFNN